MEIKDIHYLETEKYMDACYLIFICPFDPFGKGRHIYTFRNLCVEDKKLELSDGAIKIFLNAKGRDGAFYSQHDGEIELFHGKGDGYSADSCSGTCQIRSARQRVSCPPFAVLKSCQSTKFPL